MGKQNGALRVEAIERFLRNPEPVRLGMPARRCLLTRRTELAGQIEGDSVILQFDPSHQVVAIRPNAVPAAG
jgi:hypothetical protein